MYTQNDCLTFGQEPTLWFHTAPCAREPQTFKAECLNVARLLSVKAAALSRDVVVLLSGGLDSEVTCKSFLDARIPLRVLTWRFTDGLNSHEVYFAEAFAKRHGLTLEYLDIDPIEFLRTEARDLYLSSNCQWAVMTFHMKAIDHVWATGGFPVLGGYPIHLVNVRGEWHLEQFEYVTAWFHHVLRRNIETGLAFFQYTPEIALAFVSEDRFDAAPIDESSLRLKYNIYRKYWPDLVPRTKYTGAEQIKSELRAFEASIGRAKRYDRTFRQPLSEFSRSLKQQCPGF